MIFKRRDKAPIWRRIREVLAPRKGWRRGYIYLGKRMQRLPDTPHRIALGFACGVQASFTPFFGFHFIIAAALAWLTRSNILASALGTFVGNPLTFPLIAGSSLYVGYALTGITVHSPDPPGLHWLWENLGEIFIPYLIGGLAPGFVTSAAFYFTVRPLVAAYQSRRRNRLMVSAKRRMKRHAEKMKEKRAAKAAKADGAA